MSKNRSGVPELMPVLSPGRHRNPRRGACFMEFASYMAGEKWSDHPACTDPSLAALARGVNDNVSDEARSLLVPMIPRVIGLRSDDQRIYLRTAIIAAACALPIASSDRQRALAVAVLALMDILGEFDGDDSDMVEIAENALALAPEATRWSMQFQRWVMDGGHLRRNARQAAQVTLQLSVVGVAEACVLDTDDRLVDMLTRAIEDAEKQIHRSVTETAPQREFSYR
jgi:hypothetical protein